jgi:F-type H+-transporting ATPase subunit alpha
VSSFGSGVAGALGHPSHSAGQVLRGGGAEAILVAAAGGRAVGLSALVLSLSAALSAGGRLRGGARLLSVLCAAALFGSVSSPLSLQGLRAAARGRGGGPAARWLLESPAPPLVSRRAVSEPLHSGVLVGDSLAPVGRGQRQLVLGDRGTGKTSTCLDAVLGQAGEGAACVFASVGLRAPALLGISFSVLARAGAAAFVAASSRDRPALQYLAPYAAAALAEFFMWAGQVPVLAALDDLTKHAASYREVFLLLGRAPGREAYPGEVFYVHARLLERSAKLSLALGGGSVTCFPVVEALAADASAYISTNAISITDGQPLLSLELFLAGRRPAVDAGLSVSRVGSAAQWAGQARAAGSYKIELARPADLQSFAQLSSDLGPPARRALERGGLLVALLRQPCGAPLSLAQELAILSLSCASGSGPSAGAGAGAGAGGGASFLCARALLARAVPGWLACWCGRRPVASAL